MNQRKLYGVNSLRKYRCNPESYIKRQEQKAKDEKEYQHLNLANDENTAIQNKC